MPSSQNDLTVLRQLAKYLACKVVFYEKYSNAAKAAHWRQREQALLKLLEKTDVAKAS